MHTFDVACVSSCNLPAWKNKTSKPVYKTYLWMCSTSPTGNICLKCFFRHSFRTSLMILVWRLFSFVKIKMDSVRHSLLDSRCRCLLSEALYSFQELNALAGLFLNPKRSDSSDLQWWWLLCLSLMLLPDCWKASGAFSWGFLSKSTRMLFQKEEKISV